MRLSALVELAYIYFLHVTLRNMNIVGFLGVALLHFRSSRITVHTSVIFFMCFPDSLLHYQ